MKQRTNHPVATGRFRVAIITLLAAAGADALHAGDDPSTPRHVWPDNGIAQRKLPGAYNMFVEKDAHGQWHAWVMNGERKAQALDFFSGKVMNVKGELDDRGQQVRGFVDSAGNYHGPEVTGFTFYDREEFPNGIRPDYNSLVLAQNSDCPLSLVGLEGDNNSTHLAWERFPLYAVAKQAGATCSHLSTATTTSMDLDDGTFLLVADSCVFRLKEKDLSPAGATPGLRVIDKNRMEEIIRQAPNGILANPNDFLMKLFGLSYDKESACGWQDT